MRTDIWRLLGASFLAVAFVSAEPQTAAPEDLVLGVWDLDLSQSTFDPGPAPRSQRRSYEAHGDGVKATIETVDNSGTRYTAEYVADYDSLEYPLTGSSTVDAIALTRVNATKAKATLSHARKVIGTAERIIADAGSSMTITYAGTNTDGRKVKNVAVYRKQKN
jgi:hypothetical protein